MPAPKTLLSHVVEETFRPERHAGLLGTERLPQQAPPGIDADGWNVLLDLATEYGRAARVRERKAIAEEFAEAVRDLAVRRPRLDPQQELALRLGLPSRSITGCTPEEDRALRARWRAWQDEHGAAYRAGDPDAPEPPSLDAETLTDNDLATARSTRRARTGRWRRRLGEAA